MAKFKGAPATIIILRDAQIDSRKFAIVAFEFVAIFSIDLVDREVRLPVWSPFFAIKAFHHKDNGLDVAWDGTQPSIVGFTILRKGSK